MAATTRNPKRPAASRPGKPELVSTHPIFTTPRAHKAYKEWTYLDQLILAAELARDYGDDPRFQGAVKDARMLAALRKEREKADEEFSAAAAEMRTTSERTAEPKPKPELSLREQARAVRIEHLTHNFESFLSRATPEEIHFLDNVLTDHFGQGDLFVALSYNLHADTDLEQAAEERDAAWAVQHAQPALKRAKECEAGREAANAA